MKHKNVFFAVGFLSSISMAAVTGTASFSGVAPKAEVIKMSGDPNCAKTNEGKKVMKEDVVVNANKTLANVFVYVKEGVKKESVPAVPTTPVKFEQNMFDPLNPEQTRVTILVLKIGLFSMILFASTGQCHRDGLKQVYPARLVHLSYAELCTEDIPVSQLIKNHLQYLPAFLLHLV